MAYLLALTGREEEAKSILKELKAEKKYVSDVQIACILYGLNRVDEAFDHLEHAYRNRAGDLANIMVMPEMRELRKDSRWISLVKRMGLPDA